MTKKKLVELRCRAWGITEDEYYCNQCSDFSLEDMARAYRRGKNKGRAELEKENAELNKKIENLQKYLDTQNCYQECAETWLKLDKAKEYIKLLLMNCVGVYESTGKTVAEIQAEAEQFLNSEVEKCTVLNAIKE